MSVRLSAWKNSDTIGRILMKFDIWDFLGTVEKIQVSLKSNKNNEYFTWRRFHIYDYLAGFLLEWEMFQMFYRKSKHTFYNSVTFFPKIVPFMRWCRKIWWNQGTQAIWRLRVAYCVNLHARAHTHNCVILIAFPRKQWFREGAKMLRYTYIVCLVPYFSNTFHLEFLSLRSIRTLCTHPLTCRFWIGRLHSPPTPMSRMTPIWKTPMPVVITCSKSRALIVLQNLCVP